MRLGVVRKASIAPILFCLCMVCSMFCAQLAWADEGVDFESTQVKQASGQVDAIDGTVEGDVLSIDSADQDSEGATVVESGELEAAEAADVASADELEIALEAADKAAEADGQAGDEPESASTADQASQDQQAANVADAGAMIEVASGPSLENGDYVIATGIGWGYVLDVQWGSMSDGGNVQLYSYNGSDAQKWNVTKAADGTYTIKNLKSGKVLDLSGGRVANGSNIHQYSSNNTKAQKWLLSESGDGFALLSALDNKYALDVAGGYAGNGSNVQLYKANGTAAQRFLFTLVTNSPANAGVKYDTPIAVGDYIVQSATGNQYVLDVQWGSKASGANVQTYTYNGSDAQKWHLSYDADGLYTITSIASNKPLDLSGASAWYGSNVHQYAANGTKAQKWIITGKDGQYKIASAIDAMFVLDVSGGSAYNGANIQVYCDNGTGAQKFLFMTANATIPTSEVIADGVYAIAAHANKNYVVEVSGGSTANGANVQLYKDNASNAQRWGFVRNSDGLYSIFNMTSGKMLDVYNGSPLPGANISQYASNDTKAQRWSLVKDSGSTYSLVSAISGLVVDIAGGKIANGSNIQTYTSNGTAAQLFDLISKPLLEDRSYTILATVGNEMAVDLPEGSRDDGKKLTVYSSNETMAQHIVAKKVSGDNYTLQVVASSKYLTDESGSVVQRSAKSDASQQWTAILTKGGVAFKNAATGKFMNVSSKSPKNGTSLVTGAEGATSKFGLRSSNMIADGLYTLTAVLSSKGRVLDVEGGSWANGANVELYSSNNSNAQKFTIKHIQDGYYRLTLTLSEKAVDVAGGSKDKDANVDIYSWNSTDAQLWKVGLADDGITFTNKGSGLLLAVAKGSDKDGANVTQQEATDKYSQAWLLSKTTFNANDMNTVAQLVRAVSGSKNATATWTVDPNAWNGLMQALQNCWNAGYDVGFIMTDLQTGHNIAMNADKTYYGACTIKASYITWIMQTLVDPGYVSLSHVYDRMYPAIHDSENSTYLSLRSEFGSDGYMQWLREVGIFTDRYLGNYDFYTPRELQLMWVRMLAYEQSNGANVGTWRALFGDTQWTPIAYELRGNENIVYSKPGWYSGGGAYQTLSDSGIIVRPNDGRKYFLTIMGTFNPDDYGIKLEMAVARALDTIMRGAPTS